MQGVHYEESVHLFAGQYNAFLSELHTRCYAVVSIYSHVAIIDVFLSSPGVLTVSLHKRKGVRHVAKSE